MLITALSSNQASGKRSRSWHSVGGKMSARRLVSQLMCRRLPLLVIWTLVMIVILYKSLNQTNLKNSDDSKSEFAAVVGRDIRLEDTRTEVDDTPSSQPLQLIINTANQNPQLSPDNNPIEDSSAQQSTSSSVIVKVGNQSPLRYTTKKSQSDEYSRRCKVFILIIQDEHFKSIPNSRTSRRSPSDIGSASSSSSQASTSAGQNYKLIVPAHIRFLITILESHKISYDIGSTRTGLPTPLLTDQDNESETKQYSVIVIDDFIKYTKLSRWARDQLDRHCRINQIGVIAFLNSGLDLNERHSYSAFNNHRASRQISRSSGAMANTAESLADQFPVTFKPINLEESKCKKYSNLNCLTVDYKVNEKNPILRILKRRKNFILNGSIASTLNQLPWMTMSSNHITYEPLVWARLHQPPIVSDNKHSTNYGVLPMIQNEHPPNPAAAAAPVLNYESSNTQERNQNLSLNDNEQGRRQQLSSNLTQRRSKRHNLTAAAATVDYELQDSIGGATESHNQNQARHRRRALITKPQQDSRANVDTVDLNFHDMSSFADNISSSSSSGSSDIESELDVELQVLSMFDRGLYDGIKRVIFGGINHHWLNRVLILDAIEHLSSGRILDPLERYIQIDIDDIFVGERGKRMKESDVDALIETQKVFASRIEGGFKFNLGFSGKYFKHGFEEENLGDLRLVEKANHFYWFCHTWSHSKAHLFNETSQIEEELRKNLRFAREHRLPIIGNGLLLTTSNGNESATNDSSKILEATYAVAPHHSGVYPIHEQLFDAWKRVWNVQVTSTEEYPHLRPASGRRAFVHKTIKVLPRQTCGLYTHTILRDKYPGGIERLDSMIKGGELFETILHNPVNIYMTHMSNYANDRLAEYTFSLLLDFVEENTNLQLKYVASNGDNGSPTNQLGPLVLSDLYFKMYPNERQPLWTNPCSDKRHLAIWANAKQRQYCSRVPKLLIVGPQKTGTTALHSFLKVNPIFQSSHLSAEDYEEVQFFNDKHYNSGVDWYFDRFVSQNDIGDINNQSQMSQSTSSDDVTIDDVENTSAAQRSNPESVSDDSEDVFTFDKSATYFDDPKVPERASVLLPDAYIVILLVNPADRAYSWYQHMKAHNDSAANSMTFEELISSAAAAAAVNGAGIGNSKPLSSAARSLLNRCLHPGYYAQHLSRWLNYYPSRKIIIIDGQWFKQNPASVMNKLQLLLRLNQPLDYRRLLVYSEQKGFYCVRENVVSGMSNAAAATQHDSHKLKCLGKSKGRKYPPMSEEARVFLNRHFWPHSRQLARILSDIGQPLPIWLDEVLGAANSVIY